MSKSYIGYFDFDGLSTTIDNPNEWVKLNTNTTSVFSNNGLIHTNNRITNSNNRILIIKMEGILSVSTDTQTEIHAAFFKNGNLIPCSEQSTITTVKGNKSYANALPFHCIADLNTNDYIEVWVKNKNNTDNVILDNINVIITEL